MATTKSVLTKFEADKVAVTYSPRKFPASISPQASQFVVYNTGNESGFQIDEIVAEQTGIAEIERLSLEEKVERQALDRLKNLQEQAYQQAYALGLDEGREQAFQAQRAEFEQKVQHFEAIILTIERLKGDLVASNETQILRLVTYLVKRLVMAEITERPELVLEVIRTAIASAQSDEEVTVRLSPSDLAFVENTREKLGKKFDSLQKAKLEASDLVSDGGCIIETNYGDVDATMEQRFEKLWAAISEKLPKVKNVVGG